MVSAVEEEAEKDRFDRAFALTLRKLKYMWPPHAGLLLERRLLLSTPKGPRKQRRLQIENMLAENSDPLTFFADYSTSNLAIDIGQQKVKRAWDNGRWGGIVHIITFPSKRLARDEHAQLQGKEYVIVGGSRRGQGDQFVCPLRKNRPANQKRPFNIPRLKGWQHSVQWQDPDRMKRYNIKATVSAAHVPNFMKCRWLFFPIGLPSCRTTSSSFLRR